MPSLCSAHNLAFVPFSAARNILNGICLFASGIVGEDICAEDPIICDDVIELVCGQHQGAFNNSRMPVVAGGTSTMNIMHWAQWMRSHVYQRFDWGSAALNMKYYNQTTPPKYDISNYPKSLPTAVFYGGADALVRLSTTRNYRARKNWRHGCHNALWSRFAFQMFLNSSLNVREHSALESNQFFSSHPRDGRFNRKISRCYLL
jgi:hypothetical protein